MTFSLQSTVALQSTWPCLRGVLFAGLLVLGSSGVASAAAPKGAVSLSSDRQFKTKAGARTILCGNLPPWSPGRMTGGRFYPTKTEIAALKRSERAARNNAKSAIQTRIKSLSAYLNAGKSACRTGKPSTTPTPTPSPTPVPGSGNSFFDGTGRVTAAGKVAFGIPSNLSASVGAGISAWKQECASCHGAQAGVLRTTSFSPMKARVQVSPMSFAIPAELTEQQIADIVAYANF